MSTFSDFYASLGPPNPENVPEDGKLKSEMMIKDNRRYYLDLKENSRGRFLRVSVSAMNIYCFSFQFINGKEYRILNYHSETYRQLKLVLSELQLMPLCITHLSHFNCFVKFSNFYVEVCFVNIGMYVSCSHSISVYALSPSCSDLFSNSI